MSGTARRWLERSTQIRPTADVDTEPWWRKFDWRDVRAFRLMQADDEIAVIRTFLEADDGFSTAMLCRMTRVTFANERWAISTRSPEFTERKSENPRITNDYWLVQDRLIEAEVDGERIAHLAHLADARPVTAKTAGGVSMALTSQRRHIFEADGLTIRRHDEGFELDVTAPVPLEGALLFWHVMLGDYLRPVPIV